MTSKPLDQMSTQELKLAWGKRAKKFLVGKKIVDVYYHSEEENEEIFFNDDYQTNVRIVSQPQEMMKETEVELSLLPILNSQ